LRKVKTNLSGELLSSEIKYFGGAYSFREKIKMNGIGSPRMIYDLGIPQFDGLERDVANEIGFVNFELLKNGLIIRLNINNRTACVGIRLSEISKIKLKGFLFTYNENSVFRGELTVIGEWGHLANFVVMGQEYNRLFDFFTKRTLADKFEPDVDMKAPPPQWNLEDYMDILNEFLNV